MPSRPQPISGAVYGPRHIPSPTLFSGGHSLHPLQRIGVAVGSLMPSLRPGGTSFHDAPPTVGVFLGMPPTLNLNLNSLTAHL